MAYDTLLIDGTDLKGLAREITVFDSILGPGEMRGDDLLVPGRPGETFQYKVAPARTVRVGVDLTGQDPSSGAYAATQDLQRKQFNDNLRTLKKLVWKEGAALTLTRRQAFVAGDEEHAADAVYLRGLEPELAWVQYGRLVLEFKLLSGVWYATSDTTLHPGTITFGGEARTRRAVITLGSAGTLANTTTGTSVTVSAATVLTVLTGASSTGFDKVTAWSGPAWFEAAPGSNVVTWSGTGTPDIAYRAAYL